MKVWMANTLPLKPEEEATASESCHCPLAQCPPTFVLCWGLDSLIRDKYSATDPSIPVPSLCCKPATPSLQSFPYDSDIVVPSSLTLNLKSPGPLAIVPDNQRPITKGTWKIRQHANRLWRSDCGPFWTLAWYNTEGVLTPFHGRRLREWATGRESDLRVLWRNQTLSVFDELTPTSLDIGDVSDFYTIYPNGVWK